MGKILKNLLFILFLLLVNVGIVWFVGSLVAEKVFWEKIKKDADDRKTIVVNKTEQIVVENNNPPLSKITEKILPGVVKIFFLDERATGNGKMKFPRLELSGVIVSGDGLICTILPEQKLSRQRIEVLLSDGRIFTTNEYFEDKFNGLLFIKIDVDNLPAIPFADVETLANGEYLIGVGTDYAPFSHVFSTVLVKKYVYDFSVKNRNFLFSDENSEFYILDKKMADDFLGGVGVNFNGFLVGLIGKRDGEATFLVPVKNIKMSLDKLIKESKIVYPRLGVYYLMLDEILKMENGLPVSEGAMIYVPSGKSSLAMMAGSAGRQAGLLYGDIILAVNDHKVNSKNPLGSVLSKFKKGDEVVLKVLRGKEEVSLKVKLL